MVERFEEAMKNIKQEIELGEVLVKRDLMQGMTDVNKNIAT